MGWLPESVLTVVGPLSLEPPLEPSVDWPEVDPESVTEPDPGGVPPASSATWPPSSPPPLLEGGAAAPSEPEELETEGEEEHAAERIENVRMAAGATCFRMVSRS